MKVTVVDRDLQRQLWGWGYQSIEQIITTVEIADTCPVCGGLRGAPHMGRFHEDGEWYSVDLWSNPCGHLDMYDAVLEEARTIVCTTARVQA